MLVKRGCGKRSEQSGSGVTRTDTFNSRLQPITLSAASPSATVFSLTYDFHFGSGNNGNVFGVTNNRDSTRSTVFTYDQLNRVQTAQTSSSNLWGEQFTVDAWGNLTNIGGYNGKPGENLNTSALANNQLTGFGYDAAGNETSNGSATYTYDAENRIVSAASITYTYDGDGERVKKSSGTLYWGPAPLAESDLSGNITAEYVFLNGKRIARVDISSGAVHYYFSDHLGSTSVTTNSTGSIENDSDFYPYGGERVVVSDGANHYKFTGKERDGGTSNDYFGTRYYSSNMGRFMSPDWAARPTAVPYAVFGDPQSLNLYGYVRNDPVTLADADGHDVGMNMTSTSSVDGHVTIGSVPIGGPSTFENYDGVSRQQTQQNAQQQRGTNAQAQQHSTGEGSPANAARRQAIADAAEDGYERARLTQHDPYGPDECSRFVSDSIKGGGAKAEFTLANGSTRPPLAGEWANPTVIIPNWRVLGPNEKPTPGDVAAYSLHSSTPGATGDSAVVTRGSSGLTAVHAGEHGILHVPNFIRDNPRSYQDIVYRRYTGE